MPVILRLLLLGAKCSLHCELHSRFPRGTRAYKHGHTRAHARAKGKRACVRQLCQPATVHPATNAIQHN